jgi:hypothetical protein
MPGVHSLQTNVATYFSLNNTFPTAAATLAILAADGDSAYFSIASAGTALTFTLNKAATQAPGGPLFALSNQVLVTSALYDGTTKGMIKGWVMSGNLSTALGLGAGVIQ